MLDWQRQKTSPPTVAEGTAPGGTVPSAVAVERVVRQLLEALLFEGCLDSVAVANSESSGHTFYFTLGRRHFSCGGRVRGFSRVSLNIASLVELIAGTRHRAPLMEILHWAVEATPGDQTAKLRLLNEILQTIYWTQWNLQNLPQLVSRRHLDYPQLETRVWEGHPYHPCFKARSGFTETDHRRYSPEGGTPFQLRWLAVPCEQARWTFLAEDFTELAPADFFLQQCDKAIIERCCQLDLNPAHYVLVPVHPWQWQNCLRPKLDNSKNLPELIDLGELGDFYLATQSTRTLMNVSRPDAAHIKLPLDIVCTSSRRHLLSHGICAAPAISRWLAECVAEDDFFAKYRLITLREFGGVLVDKNAYDAGGDPAISQFSALWRENIADYLEADEQAVPMTALLVNEADGKPFVDHWVQYYGVEAWLPQLLQVVILPVWHLLAHHGIAVEAHAQNTLLIHRDGWPVGLALRDFHESIEYVPAFVRTPEKIPDFDNLDTCFRGAPADRFYWMTSLDALRELYMDTLYIFHLAELARVLDQHYAFDEYDFWRIAAQQLDYYAAAGWCDPARLQQLDCAAPRVRAESLVCKKLWDVPADEYHHWVANPLAEHQ